MISFRAALSLPLIGVTALGLSACGGGRDAPQVDIAAAQTKLTVYILDRTLRADGLRVAAVRQQNNGGNWVDVPVRAGTVQKLEEAILSRARDLRRSQIG